MPICASSIPDACRIMSAALFLGAIASPGAAQEPVPANRGAAADAPASTSPAMERLKAALGARRADAPHGPAALPALPQVMRRRAFEGLDRRKAAPDVEQRARGAHAQAAGQLEEGRDTMTARLYQALGLAPPGSEASGLVAQAQSSGAPSTGAWVPVLFVSSSMPIATLRTYAGQLERAHGVLSFRGVPGGLGRIGPMAKLSAEILRQDPGCEGPACAMRDVQLIVDPILFRQHGVRVVPALGMIPGDPTAPYCERENEDAPSAAHLVFGDAALSGLFEEYRRLGGAREVRDAETSLSRR